MALSTHSPLSLRAPLDDLASAKSGRIIESLSALREPVGLANLSDQGLINIRGQGARAILTAVYGETAESVGDVAVVSDGLAACLRPDRIAILTPEPQEAWARLQAASSDRLLTVTDITHGQGFMLLAGDKAGCVLPKVCGLDFADHRFPDLHAAQTMLAKVRTLILRCDRADIPAYVLIVDRSLAAYVWGIVLDAAQEFDGMVLHNDLDKE